MAAPMCRTFHSVKFMILTKPAYRMTGATWCRIAHYMQKCQMSSTSHELPQPGVSRGDNLPVFEDMDDIDTERSMGKTPKQHFDNVKKKPDHPEDARILKMAVIGIPNAGKSTLINRLMGWKVFPVSSRVHTTRKTSNCVMVEDNKQIVFVDTPGLINPSSRKKHKVEKPLVYGPELGVQAADLVAVIVDAADKWTRNQLDRKILQVLQLHKDTPSILILNKIDAMRSRVMLLHITRMLTEGIVGGKKIEFSTKALKRDKQNFDVKAYLQKLDENIITGESADEQSTTEQDDMSSVGSKYKTPIISLQTKNKTVKPKEESKLKEDLQAVIQKGKNMSEEQKLYLSYLSKMKDVAKDVRDQSGWPHFDRVFMISALENDGVNDLKNYLLDRTQPGDWLYHSSVVVDENPVNVAKQIVWEKLMDHLPKGPIPYQLSPEIVLWEVDEDGYLNIIMDIRAHDRYQYGQILGAEGSIIKRITQEAKQEILNAFRCEVRFKVEETRGVIMVASKNSISIGKRTILSAITDDPSVSLEDVDLVLWSVQNNLLRGCGFDVLRPQCSQLSTGSGGKENQKVLTDWKNLLENIETDAVNVCFSIPNFQKWMQIKRTDKLKETKRQESIENFMNVHMPKRVMK